MRNERSHDSYCFVCGEHNRQGLRLRYQSEQPGVVSTFYQPDARYQSYENVLHGGIQSLLLDACMIQALRTTEVECVTAKLEIRYVRIVTLDTALAVSAHLVKRFGFFYNVESEIHQNGLLKTRAVGFYRKKVL